MWKTFSFHSMFTISTSTFISISNQHHCFLFFLIITAVSTLPYLSYPHTFHHQQHHQHQHHHHHHQSVHRHYHQESCSYIQVADSPSSYLDEQFITSILTHSRTANAPYDDLLRSWHHQSPRIKIYWHHSKLYSFLAERPTEVKVSIFIRSMGPISEADMVSTYWYSETLTVHFHFYFSPSLFTFLDDSYFLLSPVLFHGLLLSPVLARHQTFLPGVQT